jgi:hypothetical protein
MNQELESNGFGPPDVALSSMECLPPWGEYPGSPVAADNNSDAHARAGI